MVDVSLTLMKRGYGEGLPVSGVNGMAYRASPRYLASLMKVGRVGSKWVPFKLSFLKAMDSLLG
jgi:hypothetical protein